jgi:ribosome maturation factor RimP
MERSAIIQRTWTDLEPFLRQLGYELVEAEIGKHGNGWLVRLFIDKPAGITVDDCAAVSHAVGPLLDDPGFIPGSYLLEVSSPGFDRPIRKPADFQRFAGEKIKVATIAPIAGRKRFTGVLKGISDGLVAVECGEQVVEVHIENLHRANLDR